MFVFYLRLLVLLLNPLPSSTSSYLYLSPLPTTTSTSSIRLTPSSYLLTFLPLGLFASQSERRIVIFSSSFGAFYFIVYFQLRTLFDSASSCKDRIDIVV